MRTMIAGRVHRDAETIDWRCQQDLHLVVDQSMLTCKHKARRVRTGGSLDEYSGVIAVFKPCVKPDNRSSETIKKVLSGSSMLTGSLRKFWNSIKDCLTMEMHRSNTG